jgi:hypothetical protein
MGYLADWRLTERSEGGILRLIDEAGSPRDGVSLEREATGLTLLITVLNAPPGTELYRRLEREGRLLGAFCGETIGDTNILPHMGQEPLLRGCHALVNRLYAPRTYYARVQAFSRRCKGPKEQMPLNGTLVLAALRCLFWPGLIRQGRGSFWRVLVWTIFHKRNYL